MEATVEARLIAVIGAGAMGSGIAQVAATSGFRVNLSDVSTAVLEKALVSIRKSLARLVKAGTLTEAQAEGALSRIVTTTDPAEAVSEAQAVIEAVPEDLALKLEVFRRLDGGRPRTPCFSPTPPSSRSPSSPRRRIGGIVSRGCTGSTRRP